MNSKHNHYINTLAITALSLTLTACGSGDHSDLKAWVKGQEQTVRAKVEPLPRNADYAAIPFEGAPSIDPFKSKQIGPILDPSQSKKTETLPEVNRRKEPLEAYALSELTIMGFVRKDNVDYILVRTAKDSIVHTLSVGNYMGNNYGRIIRIKNDVVTLREIVLQGEEWVEKVTELMPLAESTDANSGNNTASSRNNK